MKKIWTLTYASLFTFGIISSLFPSTAKAENQFDVCVRELTSSGVETAKAQTGCATALIPRDLSSCVRNITQLTAVSPDSALQNCYQVRRPLELSTCVVNINNTVLVSSGTKNNDEKTQEDSSMNDSSPLMMALNTCRQSLLPARHSECVIALSRTPNVSNAVEAMETCLTASDFPPVIFPVDTNQP